VVIKVYNISCLFLFTGGETEPWDASVKRKGANAGKERGKQPLFFTSFYPYTI
jgi:hypothetical protein